MKSRLPDEQDFANDLLAWSASLDERVLTWDEWLDQQEAAAEDQLAVSA